MIYDVFVAGLGVMGSAVTRALARAGMHVVACDALEPPHNLGSSHGESRIIRAAYFEDPIYVPLATRAFQLWRELESETGRSLLRVTGGLNIGPADGALVQGALLSAREHGIAHELLDGAEAMQRFPALHLRTNDVAVFEPDAGILNPEEGVSAQIESARSAGAELHLDEALTSWKRTGAELRVKTTNGEYAARSLVLAVGAWLPTLRPDLPLRVTRQPVFWFETMQPNIHSATALPHYLIEFEPERVFYGFPDLGNGLKCAIHHQGATTTPQNVDRALNPTEHAQARALVEQFFPSAAGPLRNSSVCLYTNTPDHHFLIDSDPTDPGVWLFSPCSGHGFKFAPALAELLTKTLTAGTDGQVAPAFALSRATLRNHIRTAVSED